MIVNVGVIEPAQFLPHWPGAPARLLARGRGVISTGISKKEHHPGVDRTYPIHAFFEDIFFGLSFSEKSGTYILS